MKCSSDLDTHKIVWVIETTATGLVNDFKPSRPDNRKECSTTRDFISEPLNEVDSKRNAVDIHKDVAVTQFGDQCVAEAAGRGCAILTTIA